MLPKSSKGNIRRSKLFGIWFGSSGAAFFGVRHSDKDMSTAAMAQHPGGMVLARKRHSIGSSWSISQHCRSRAFQELWIGTTGKGADYSFFFFEFVSR